MSSDDTARLIYLGLLGAVIAGVYVVQGRRNIGQVLQYGLIWAFLFIGVAAAYGLWTDIQRDALRGQMTQIGAGQIAVPLQADGHYYLTLDVNGQPIRFVVDTGASDIVLTAGDARAAGIDTDALIYSGRANTANGQVRTAPVRLDRVRLGDVTDENVRAVVNEGDMNESLLGMGYLQRWGKIEIAGGELVLTR